jgi:hypothetical protein
LERINGPVARHHLLALRAKSHDALSHCGFYAVTRWLPAVALLAAAPPRACSGSVGIGIYHHVCRNDAYHWPPRYNSQFLVDRRWQCTTRCCRLLLSPASLPCPRA